MAKGRAPGNKKTLEEHIRDGTFRPERHRDLLEQRDATVAQWKAKSVRQGGPLTPAEHFSLFSETFIKHTIGRWHGQPFKLEPWQRDIINELLAVDKNGNRDQFQMRMPVAA